MDGIYPKILKQAFRLTKSQKFFWSAGLFLVWPNLLRGILIITLVLAGFSWGPDIAVQEQEMQQGNPWIGLGALLLMGLAMIYYFRNKTGVVLAIKHLQAKSQIDRKKIYEESEPHVANSIKYSLFSAVFLATLSAFLLSPVIYLFSNNYAFRALALGVLALIAYLPIAGLIYCAMIFAPMFMAVHFITAWDATRASIDVFRGNWRFLLKLWLILLAIELGGLVVATALMFVAMTPFVLLMQIFYDVGGSAGANVLQALGGIAAFVVFFMSQAIVAAFQRVAWAIAFFEIVRPVKMDEAEEPETIPEVIS